MNESISIEHKIQYFSVTREPTIKSSSRGKAVLVTEGKCTKDLPRVCPICGGVLDIHDRQRVYIQDYEILGHVSILGVKYCRCKCRMCGRKQSQELPFRSRHHMMTRRLEVRVHRRLNQGATLIATAISLGIHPSIVKEIDKRRLQGMEVLSRPPRTRNIGIDEFLLHKGHHYATVVVDIDRASVIFLEKGKKKEQAEHFISKMGKEWMSEVRAVSMDMNAQYDSAFRQHAPHVKIVYDKFHMVKMYNDLVLTAIRRRLQGECVEKEDKRGYELLKGSRFLVLTSPKRLHEKEMAARDNNRFLNENYARKGLSNPPGARLRRIGTENKLHDLLAANSDLSVAYTLLDQFNYAYDVTSEDIMSKGLQQWYRLANQSKVPEILKFVNTIKSHEDGLINRVMHKISSGVVEGINNMIKTLRRKAYGFRDTEYFFLKIKFESLKPRLRYLSPKFLS